MARFMTIMAIAFVILLTGSAVGQSSAEPVELTPATDYEPQFVDLRVVDEGIEDVGSLNGSLRSFSPGLHQPNDFDRVYQAPDGESFMRVQGALFALYPRAVSSGSGAAAIPPGTMFYIGEPSPFDTLAGFTNSSTTPATLPPGAALRWNTRLNAVGNDDLSNTSIEPTDDRPTETRRYSSTVPQSRRIDTPRETETIDSDRAPAIVVDEAYRRQRLQELMQLAARSFQAAP